EPQRHKEHKDQNKDLCALCVFVVKIPCMEIHIPQMSIGGGDDRGGAQSYTVQPGDTLESIAKRFGLELSELIGENFKSGLAEQLQPGQELQIPLGEGVQTLI